MSKIEGGVRLSPPPSRIHVTIFSRRLLGLIKYYETWNSSQGCQNGPANRKLLDMAARKSLDCIGKFESRVY